jgi:multicomponent Na+:H+ antiporter subunit D
LNIAVLASNIQFSFLDKIALVLLISGLAMKAGIVPMHMWLPDAYGRAPSSVTLLLIVATQASLYGALRMIFTLFGGQLSRTVNELGGIEINMNLLIGATLVGLAILTIFVGVLMALKESDFKRMIGFAAVAEIGYMILAIGAALTIMFSVDDIETSRLALNGGVFHIFNDALDVGLLFLVAGAVYYATKETSLNRLGGLARNMKYTTVFFLIGLLAVAGMPPMNGFSSKLIIYESTFLVNPILSIIAILCSILLLAVFVKVFYSAFLGPKQSKFENVKEAPKSMLVAMAIVAGIILFIGLFPDIFINNIVEPATRALVNSGEYIQYIMGVV